MPNTEERVINPTTGGAKGQKDSRLSQAPPEALLELGRVYAHGESKYARHNYRKGYNWSLCYDALLRHVLASIDGEDIDPESGLLHMAHAAWHALTLTQFYLDKQAGRHPAELDDRFSTVPTNCRCCIEYPACPNCAKGHHLTFEERPLPEQLGGTWESEPEGPSCICTDPDTHQWAGARCPCKATVHQ